MIEIFLKQMGYRCLSNGKWCKPCGFTLLVASVEEENLVISQWFMSASEDKPLLHKSESLNISEITSIGYVQTLEAKAIRNGYYFYGGNYELLVPELTITEQLEDEQNN